MHNRIVDFLFQAREKELVAPSHGVKLRQGQKAHIDNQQSSHWQPGLQLPTLTHIGALRGIVMPYLIGTMASGADDRCR